MERLNKSFRRSVFAANIVGFSKLVSKKEYAPFVSIKECVEIITQTVISQKGCIFHTASDSVLAEFADCNHALTWRN